MPFFPASADSLLWAQAVCSKSQPSGLFSYPPDVDRHQEPKCVSSAQQSPQQTVGVEKSHQGLRGPG